MINKIVIVMLFFLSTVVHSVYANSVEIIDATLKKNTDAMWSVSVTLKHADTGWDHYANNWRIINEKGNVIGDRVLYHPHVNEQPFTRSLSNVSIKETDRYLYIIAHDTINGWSPEKLKIDLSQLKNGMLKVVK